VIEECIEKTRKLGRGGVGGGSGLAGRFLE
jgi:hypothetical protein